MGIRVRVTEENPKSPVTYQRPFPIRRAEAVRDPGCGDRGEVVYVDPGGDVCQSGR